MGFDIRKEKYGFVPVIWCDVCREVKMSGELNVEHDWDCRSMKIVCKDCCREKGIKGDAWMEMRDYLYCLVKNSRVDMDTAEKINDVVG